MLITQTPLRISLAGGGTDLPEFYRRHGGAVLSTAIDKYVYVIINERYDDKIYIDYSRKEIVEEIDEIEHDLVREAARITGMTNGFEVMMMADIPSEGSGLGSSSSITVGLLNAFYHYRGLQVPAEQLAREACRIEIEILGRPIGRQDQYIAAYGGLRLFEFSSTSEDPDHVVERTVPVEPSEIRRLGSNLLLFFTSIVRKSSSILSDQRQRIDDNLGRHTAIRDLVYEAREAIATGEHDEIGRMLHENWMVKKELASGITTPEIDRMYAQAIEAGAVGGKISGAGGGGFLLCYCKRDRQDELRQAMAEYREMPFMFDPFGSRVIFQQRRYTW